MNFKFLLLGLLIPLAACNSENINITSTPLNYQITQPASPPAVSLTDLNFKVVTKNNLDAFVKAQTSSQGDNPVFIVMDSTGYKSLNVDLAELRRYIKQQQSIIVYYKAQVDAVNNVSSKPNKK